MQVEVQMLLGGRGLVVLVFAHLHYQWASAWRQDVFLRQVFTVQICSCLPLPLPS